MKRLKQISFITDKLGELKNKVEIKSSINLTDINIVAEDFFCTFLNLLYGYNLKNLNIENSNTASIDLGDRDQKVAFQVTSTTTAAKIDKTVSKFIKNELYKTYDTLFILFITNEYNPRKKLYGGGEFKFYTEKGVIDLKSLTKKVNSLTDTELDEAYQLFVNQFSCLNPAEKRLPLNYRSRVRRFNQAYLGSENTAVPFGGRDNELADLNEWLLNGKCSNLLLTSPAGRGKSALVVQWISKLPTDWKVIFAPISVRFETNSASVFYELLANQLSLVLNVTLSASDYDTANYYKEKVLEYIHLLEKSEMNTLVVIDGLDEASGWEVGEMLIPELKRKNLKFLVSARLLADKNEESWAVQLGWKCNLFMEVPLLTKQAVKDLILSTKFSCLPSLQVDEMTLQLHRLSEGEPLLLNLYLTDLLKEKESISGDLVASLSEHKAGFEAYFKRWIDEQQKIVGESFDEGVKSLLAIFACLIEPILFKDLEELYLLVSHRNIYIEEDKLKPIQRFLYGNGIDEPYTLSHPLFGIYLKENYFKNGKRIKDTQLAIVDWGKQTIDSLYRDKLALDQVPYYLLRCYSQHLVEYNVTLEEAVVLLCNEWRLAFLSTSDRHLGYVKELEIVSNISRMEFSKGTICLEDYYSVLLRCSIYSASINGMAKNLPAELRLLAIQHNFMTLGQAFKQIKNLDQSYQPHAMIALADYLDSEQFLDVLIAIKKVPNRKSRKQLLSKLKQIIEVKGYDKLVLEVEDVLVEMELEKDFYEPTSTELSGFLGENHVKYTNIEQAKKLLRSIELVIIELRSFSWDTSINTVIENLIKEFNSSRSNEHRCALAKMAILGLDKLPPQKLIDLMMLNAQLVMLQSSENDTSSHNVFEAHYSLLLGHFISIALCDSIEKLVIEFTEYIGELAGQKRRIDYYHGDFIVELYRFIRRNSTKNKLLCEKLEVDLIEVIGYLPSGNNRVSLMLKYIDLIDSPSTKKIAVHKALLYSELIEDESAVVKFKANIAGSSSAKEFVDNTVFEALNIANAIFYVDQHLSCYIDLIKVKDASRSSVNSDYLLNRLRKLTSNETKLRFLSQCYSYLSQEQRMLIYNDALSALEYEVINWSRITKFIVRPFFSCLTNEDKLKLYSLITQLNLSLNEKIDLLEICPEEFFDEEISTYIEELRGLKDDNKKCYLMSNLAKAARRDDFFSEALLSAKNISEPIKKIDALSAIDGMSYKHHDLLFKEAIDSLCSITNVKERKRAVVRILAFKGCSEEFLLEQWRNNVNSNDLEFLDSILGSISNLSKYNDVCIRNVFSYLKSADFSGLTKTREIKIKNNIFPYMSSEEKLEYFPEILTEKAKGSRSEMLTFIAQHLPFLYEIGSEDLLASLNISVNNAREWWP